MVLFQNYIRCGIFLKCFRYTREKKTRAEEVSCLEAVGAWEEAAAAGGLNKLPRQGRGKIDLASRIW